MTGEEDSEDSEDSDETECEAQIIQNIVVSRVTFEHPDSKKYIDLKFFNIISEKNNETCRKIMKKIKEKCSKYGKSNMIEDGKEKDLKDIKYLKTLRMRIEF